MADWTEDQCLNLLDDQRHGRPIPGTKYPAPRIGLLLVSLDNREIEDGVSIANAGVSEKNCCQR